MLSLRIIVQPLYQDDDTPLNPLPATVAASAALIIETSASEVRIAKYRRPVSVVDAAHIAEVISNLIAAPKHSDE